MLFIPWQSQTNSEQQERNKQQGQNGPRVKIGFCCLPPDRVKPTVNSKKETNSRVKMDKESKWAMSQDRLLLFTPWKSQNGRKVIMSCCCLPPDRVKLIVNSRVKMGLCYLALDRVKLTVNSKKETNSRVKMGKGSRWASVIYPLKKSKWGLLLFTPWQSQTDSEQQEINKQQGQNGKRIKMGQRSRSASVL